MSGQPCDICYRWFTESYHVHNARHIAANPHAFCRTIRCDDGDDCPVVEVEADPVQVVILARARR